jgi:HprK-related kinase A
VARSLQFLYRDYDVEEDGGIADFHVRLSAPPGIRRFVRKQALFFLDGQSQFQPYPASLAPPLFEWGLNWCISHRAHRFLMIHSAVVEKRGRALLLPARPGSGKSTLTAGLLGRGYRLLSDEHALLRPEDGRVVPLPRPIALKNESIRVVRELGGDLELGPTFHDSHKGDVAHLRPLEDSVRRAGETALPAAVVFPKFDPSSPTRLEPVARAAALMELVENSVNYSVTGELGFETLARLVDEASFHALDFRDLGSALDALEKVAAGGS